MQAQKIIEKINNSRSYIDIFPDDNWKSIFNDFAKMIHPDICDLPGHKEAMQKLLLYKDNIEKGIVHEDDSGGVVYFRNKIIFTGNIDLLEKSYKNYLKLKQLAGKSTFKNYLPDPYIFKNKCITVGLSFGRAIPLSALSVLPQEHLNWILSRMLEFSSWMCKEGFSHLGINPDSMYVVPKNHGVIPVSFYHVKALTSNIKTISGRYYNFYPQRCFIEKKSASYVDIELSKRTTVYLTGDKTGTGIGLANRYNKDFINFISKFSVEHPFDVYKEYRDMLKKNFKEKFYSLEV